MSSSLLALQKECGFKCSGKSQVQAPQRRQEHLCLVLVRSQGGNVLASEGARGQTARLLLFTKNEPLLRRKGTARFRAWVRELPGRKVWRMAL